MTKIKFFKNKDIIVGLESSGHTGFDSFGKDILCATLSGIVQSSYLGLSKVLGIAVNLTRNDKEGYMKIELPSELSKQLLEKSQIIFLTVEESIKDLMSGYSQYISMEVIENVY